MNRRSFIKGLVGALAAIGIPGLSNSTPINVFENGDWRIDTATKSIEYIGSPDGPGISVLEFHRYLQNEFDSVDLIMEPNPSRRHSDEYIELENGFTVPDDSMTQLKSGTLVTKDGYWTDCNTIIRGRPLTEADKIWIQEGKII